MTKEEALIEAMKVIPKYPQTFCGCGEGWKMRGVVSLQN